jgi:hypothetical protein
MTSLWVILALIVTLNVSWLLTLSAFGSQFEQVAGFLPIDLQNTSSLLTATQAIDQIMTYSSEARLFYWVFFILDNLMPPLVFGALSLLWAYFLSRRKNRWTDLLIASPFLLIPWGVGVFDWFENLCFVVVVSDPSAANALQLMELGLIFTRIKAGFLFATFGLTFVVTGYFLLTLMLRIVRPARRQGVLSA